MRQITFDLDVLRSFVTGVDLGGFGRAADRLGRSTSAVSAQMKKLEEQAGVPLLRKAGRGLELTDAGETMLAYARRLLDLNDQAARAVRGVDLQGSVRLGLQEDFGEMLLPQVLGQFARAHPKVRIEARVARNSDLLTHLARGDLDLALAWGHDAHVPQAQHLLDLPMCWIGPAGLGPARIGPAGIGPARSDTARTSPAQALVAAHDENENQNEADAEMPLVAFEAPCLFRACATEALDRSHRPWRAAFTSPSLAGLWAAVSAGLGITVRTPLGLPASVRVLTPGEFGLPLLPSIALTLYQAQSQPGPVAAALADIVQQCIRDSWPANPSAHPGSPS